MMENRSFDHFLGWLPNANGIQAGLSYVDASGVSHPTHELGPDWTGCGYNDPDHSYDGARIEVDHGLMDGFMRTSTADVYGIGYYREADNQFLPKFARNFTTCDMYFPSILSSTFPNRIFQLCGQTDRLDDSVDLCSYPTIFNHCSQAGVGSKYYYGNVPFLTLFPIDAIEYAHSFSDFLSDSASGSLPQVSFVDPSFTLVLNTANDNHPHSDIRNGDALMVAGIPCGGYEPRMEEYRPGAEPRRMGRILRPHPAASRAGAQQYRSRPGRWQSPAGLPRALHRGVAMDRWRTFQPGGQSHRVRSYFGTEDDRIRFQCAAAAGDSVKDLFEQYQSRRRAGAARRGAELLPEARTGREGAWLAGLSVERSLRRLGLSQQTPEQHLANVPAGVHHRRDLDRFRV